MNITTRYIKSELSDHPIKYGTVQSRSISKVKLQQSSFLRWTRICWCRWHWLYIDHPIKYGTLQLRSLSKIKLQQSSILRCLIFSKFGLCLHLHQFHFLHSAMILTNNNMKLLLNMKYKCPVLRSWIIFSLWIWSSAHECSFDWKSGNMRGVLWLLSWFYIKLVMTLLV